MHGLRLLCLLLILFAVPARAASETSSDPYSPVVMYLQHIVDGDPELRAALETNLAKAGAEGPEHTFWQGKSVTDLYAFFDDWLVNPLKPTDSPLGIVDGQIVRHSYLFRDMLNADPGLRVHNVFMGWLALFMNARQQFLMTAASATHMDLWMKDPKVAIGDYVVPDGGFRSFNALFLRRLRPGARPIAGGTDAGVVVSPADCKVYETYDVALGAQVDVKGTRLDFSDLLNGDPVASEFVGGPAFTCNLMLSNYHHFHSPVAGTVRRIGEVGGIYYFDKGFQHLYEHRRSYIVFETERLGLVALVAVGQVMVNTIRIDVGQGDTVEKGQELGHFDFGGSEVVMIFQPGRVRLSGDVGPGHVFRLGEQIGVAQ